MDDIMEERYNYGGCIIPTIHLAGWESFTTLFIFYLNFK